MAVWHSCTTMGVGDARNALRALTVIHNYGLKHEDGYNGRERLFGTEHPELFPGYLNKLGELPLARKEPKPCNS